MRRKSDLSDQCYFSEPRKAFKATNRGHRQVVFKDQKMLKSSTGQQTHTLTNTHMHKGHKMTKAYSMETTPAKGSSDCRCPVPSVIKAVASACNHSILTLRHQSALQQYKPIINPQDVPTLKSFPSHPEEDQSEATFSHIVRINLCPPVTAGRKRVTQDSSLHVALTRFLLNATITVNTE